MEALTFRIFHDRSSSEEIRKARAGENEFHLPRRTLLSVEGNFRGVRIACRSGFVWLTQEGDLRDHILRGGTEITIDRKGLVLIESLGDALLSVAVS
jgi:hypothetical protein